MALKKCCVVPNCNSFNLPTYGFPRQSDERAKWAIAVGLKPEKVGLFARICLKHFKEDDFAQLSKRLTLRRDALPFVDNDAKKSDDWFEMEDKTKKLSKKEKLKLNKKKLQLKRLAKNKRNKKISSEKVKITKSTQLGVSVRNAPPLPEKIVETPDVQNTTVIDKDYYFVMINKHKKDMTFTSSKKNDVITNDVSKDHSLYSINDILNAAVKMSSSVESLETDAAFDGLKMPDCFNPECRQLAGRVYLLQKEKEKMQKIYDDLRQEVETMESTYSRLESRKNADGTETKQICASCVNGRLNNLYRINATRVNYLQQKLNEIKQENVILNKELCEISSENEQTEQTSLIKVEDMTDSSESDEK